MPLRHIREGGFQAEDIFAGVYTREDAERVIEDLIEKGERPVVTVPKQYVEALSRGLTSHSTWIPELSLITGTLGREAYLGGKDERVVIKVNVDPSHIHPRFTGPDHAFHGVVVIDGPVSPEEIEIVH